MNSACHDKSRRVLSDLHKRKNGRLIAASNLTLFISETERILNSTALAGHVAILSYGSSGGQLLTAGSDTDLVFLHNQEPTDKQLLELQERLYTGLENSPWTVSFKSWERVKTNPFDLLCLFFVSGNRDIFQKQVIEDPEILAIDFEGFLISHLANIKGVLEYTSSSAFSRLLRNYHSSQEMPDAISYGDLKYFIGGLRALTAVLCAAALFSGKKFLSEARLDSLTERGIISSSDLKEIEEALDFLLTARDLLETGTNIFNNLNMINLTSCWNQSSDAIKAAYNQHTQTAMRVLGKIQKTVLKDFPDNPAVRIASSSIKKQLELIDIGDPQLWRNIALREELDPDVREKLMAKVQAQQIENPHTKLDELESILNFRISTAPTELLPEAKAVLGEEEETEAWLTDQVFENFERILKSKVNDSNLVEQAVNDTFVTLLKAERYQDTQSFCNAYLARVKNFFHCHSIFPDQPFTRIEHACNRIVNSFSEEQNDM